MKTRKRKSFKRIFKMFIIQVLLIAGLLLLGKNLYHMPAQKDAATVDPSATPILPTASDDSFVKASFNNDMSSAIVMDSLVSRNVILVNMENQKVLFGKNSNETIYPASLTKIMTAIIAIENLNDLNQLIELSPEMFKALDKQDASMAGFLPGEAVPAIDLLYGALLPSGAECCIGLAEYISGSEDAFVTLMNEKAAALGMDHTNFTNSTGLHSPDHYSTVADLAVLLEYSLQNDTFRDIFTSKKHSIDRTNLHPDGITFYSTLFKSLESSDANVSSVLGGKTGYTSEAGLCLASLAEKNGHEYILVTAGAKGNHSTEQYNITDAVYVYSNLD